MNKRKVILIILKRFIGAAAAVAASLILIFILSRQIDKIGNSLTEKKNLSFVLERKTEITEKLRRDFNIIGDSGQKIQSALPPDDNILEFVGALESLASQSGLSQSFKFGNPADFPIIKSGLKISVIDYNISLNGNIFSLINYLKSFEKLPYFSGISSVSLSGSGWENNSAINIKAKIYVKSQ